MASSSHVLLPAELLARSPSQEDGVAASIEKQHRFWGCELIEEAGILLRLPQVVMVTAQTMLHRFYYRKSLRDFDAFRVALGCLFLAAKVEERPKSIKDVLSVFYAIYRRRKWGKTKLHQKLLELESESYYLWRDWLVMVERQILIDLGFSLYNIMEHPHKYILYYIKILDGSKELAQKAWGYLNDSLRINLCVKYQAEVIACSAIFMAARALQVKLPDAPEWFKLFDVDRESLVKVVNEILDLYKQPKIVWLDTLTQVDPFAVDDLPDIAEVAVVDDAPSGDTAGPSAQLVPERAAATPEPRHTPTKGENAEVAQVSCNREPVGTKRHGRSSSRDRRRNSVEWKRDRDLDSDRDRDRERDDSRRHYRRRSRSCSQERSYSRSSHSSKPLRSRRSRSRSRSVEDSDRRSSCSRHRRRSSRSNSRRR